MLILGNMANDGYSVAKEMRKMGMDVDLAVNMSDFGMALPEWEDADLEGLDPYNLPPHEAMSRWKPPSWIKYIDMFNRIPLSKAPLSKILARVKLLKLVGEYDAVETHTPFCIYVQFLGVPYCPYDAGIIRYFPYQGGLRPALFRRAYSKAKLTIYTNPDTLRIFRSLDYIKEDRLRFVPFAIDPEKYRPLDATSLREKYVQDSDGMLLFSPSRQMWAEKGNDRMIVAFSRFLKDRPGSKLVLVSWGIDEDRSRGLAATLGIEKSVVWIRPVPKNRLVWYYNATDIVLDQFILGSWGTSTPEAMACGKPVLMYFDPVYIAHCFGDIPPILNSSTSEDIYRNLLRLSEDEDLRRHLGQLSRDWVIRTHHPRLVAQKHYDILKQLALS